MDMKMGLKYATHVWGYYAVALAIGLMFLSGMGSTWFAIALDAVLMLAIMLMVFNDGAYNGEKACTLTVSLEKQFKEGRRIDEKLKAQVFNRKIAAWILIIGALPFLLISAVNAIVAPLYPEVIYDQAAEQEQQEKVGSFEFDYSDEQQEPGAPVNGVNVIARLVFMPFVSVYTMVRGNVLNALFFLFSLLLPCMEAVGYLCGPKMRDKKLHDIARGKKRKMRNLKVNKKPRQQKAEV